MDITASPLSSIKALENVHTALRSGGLALLVLKFPKERNIEPVQTKLSSLGFSITEILEPDRKEAYVIARKL
jgi:hypothetical protein